MSRVEMELEAKEASEQGTCLSWSVTATTVSSNSIFASVGDAVSYLPCFKGLKYWRGIDLSIWVH